MALGDAYATLSDLKGYARLTDAADDSELTRILSGSSRAVERYCGRQFNDAGSASARVFEPIDPRVAHVDDFSTAVGLVVKIDTGDNGTYDTTLDASDFTLYPLNGVSVEGITGFAYHRIQLASTATCFRPHSSRPSLEVTARWGWAAVPDAVVHGTLILATRVLGRRSSPHGAAVVGSGDFVFRISRQTDPDVAEMLDPFRFMRPVVA